MGQFDPPAMNTSCTIQGLRFLASIAMLFTLGACQTCDLPLRPPAQQMCRAPNDTCGRYNTPSFRINQIELLPDTVRAGDRMVRRIVYTYCPRTLGQSARGTMEASIFLEQKRLVRDRNVGFAIKPGRQVYDAEIRIPRAARPGIYMLITEMNGTGIADFKQLQAFEVVR